MTNAVPDAEQLLQKLCPQTEALIKARGLTNPYIVGIHNGGVWLAERIHRYLNLETPVGVLDISFYRDDFTRLGLNPKVGASVLTEPTEDRDILLVDDVLMSGRTVRAAMNELFDFGRPKSISLITLLDLEQRALPIQADLVGATLALDKNQQVKLNGPEPLTLVISERSQTK